MPASSSSRVARWWVSWNEEGANGANGARGATGASPGYRAADEALKKLLADGDAAAPQDVAAARDALRREAQQLETAPN